ncbi:methionine biosynthesis PLP-dependent protein [Alkalihalobacillus hwajinpoensis]|uniref:methionine biosynthesis PLP-dependent protein n=1 Tax=Guptibacillus hwajinpoensis TaxID=208199 RepID=UPI0018844693|nr:methionine biosynthesis PLP-dependent protein [Pseudalkalibacillus hwajinpoensis]MBF0709296.1 methionine biosynthesis PLP-dependent protein [Pseudalkalibacillus hwajinpoensis]
MSNKQLETLLVQLGNHSDTKTGAVNPPVYFSTSYSHEGIGQSTGFDYSRTKNPTRSILESAISELEHGDQGFAFSSGMAAIQAILAIFKSGDHILVSDDLYGGTFRLFAHAEKHYGISFTYFDTQSNEQLSSLLTHRTKAIFVENPSNPLMKLTDLEKIARIAENRDLLFIVDNTLFTPLLQNPLLLGADIVVHSATKYLGGHNDILAGLVVAKGENICAEIQQYQNGAGAVLSPFDSWLLMRGMKTLPLRMKQHEENARKVTEFLTNHEAITDVFYPDKGGMLSFRLRSEEWVDLFLRKLTLVTFAESLGGVESFITYPSTQTHAEIPEDIRLEKGVCNRLLRFSVGIENIDDLIQDLNQALSIFKEEVVQIDKY